MPYPWPILFEAFSGCSSFACSFRGLLRPSLSEMLDAGIPLTVCNGLDAQNIAGVPTDTIIDWLISPEEQDRSLTIDAVDEPVTALLKRLIERRSEFRQVEAYRDVRLRLLHSWNENPNALDIINTLLGRFIDRHWTYDDSPYDPNHPEKTVLKMSNRFLLFTVIVCSRPLLDPN